MKNRNIATPTPVFTVGYEGRTLPGFIELLQREGVDRVVDVRALPRSRKKGFSKNPLQQGLAAVGIQYVHVRAAGNDFRDVMKQNVEAGLALYADRLDAHPEVMTELEQALDGHRAALMCFEADVRCCHRSVLVDRLLDLDPRRSVGHL